MGTTTTKANATVPGLPKLRRPATKDHLMAKPPPWRIIGICEDMALANARLDARRTLDAAEATQVPGESEEDRAKRLAELRAEFEEAERAAEEASVQILAVSPGRKLKDALLTAHPATDEQKKEAAAEGGTAFYDVEKFPYELIAATVQVPAMSAEEWRNVTERWNSDEYVKLWLVIQEVNGTSHLVSVGKGSNGTLG